MSWNLIFKMGVGNAWILMLYLLVHPLIMLVVDKAVGRGEIWKKMGKVPYEKAHKLIFLASMVVMIIMLLYSVFLPLRTGTVWFYVSLAVYIAGLLMFLTAIVNIAVTPHGQPFSRGLYRYSRHPMLVSGSITYLAVGVASGSWIFLLLSVLLIILQTSLAVAEERGCLERYGDAYQEYINRTPRWLGLPK